MDVKDNLLERAGSVCELCEGVEGLRVHTIPPFSESVDRSVLICSNCAEQITGVTPMDVNHWRCLNKSMWSTVAPVQVVAWRLLQALRNEAWASDLLDMLYLDDEVLAWAKAVDEGSEGSEENVVHKDSNGTILQTGDTIVLIKDLDVKGGGFTAKRGTAVRGIKLVEENAEHVEGKVNGQQIVILTKYVKKA